MTPEVRAKRIHDAMTQTEDIFSDFLPNGERGEIIRIHRERHGNIFTAKSFLVRIGKVEHQFWFSVWQRGGGLAVYVWIGDEYQKKEVWDAGVNWERLTSANVAGITAEKRLGTPHKLAAHLRQPIPNN